MDRARRSPAEARQRVRIGIAEQQDALKEHHRHRPYRGRAAEARQDDLREHRLHGEQQRCREERRGDGKGQRQRRDGRPCGGRRGIHRHLSDRPGPNTVTGRFTRQTLTGALTWRPKRLALAGKCPTPAKSSSTSPAPSPDGPGSIVWTRTTRTATAIAQRIGISEILARIIAARGVGIDAAETYLEPTIRGLMPDPSTLTAMDALAERLAKAIADNEAVALFGDYDVDGACSCA